MSGLGLDSRRSNEVVSNTECGGARPRIWLTNVHLRGHREGGRREVERRIGGTEVIEMMLALVNGSDGRDQDEQRAGVTLSQLSIVSAHR